MEKKQNPLKRFLYKNISFESEESQFMLMMRFFYIITTVYIIAFYIFGSISGIIQKAPIILIWLPSCDIDKAYEYVLEIKQHIEKMPITYKNDTITVTMTFGVEEYKAEALVTELIHKADDKLYRGKTGGRNTVVK
jgi:hypothetical protein